MARMTALCIPLPIFNEGKSIHGKYEKAIPVESSLPLSLKMGKQQG